MAEAGIEVTEETVRFWGRTGKLPVVKLPSGRFFFAPEDVEAFLTPVSVTVPASSPAAAESATQAGRDAGPALGQRVGARAVRAAKRR